MKSKYTFKKSQEFINQKWTKPKLQQAPFDIQTFPQIYNNSYADNYDQSVRFIKMINFYQQPNSPGYVYNTQRKLNNDELSLGMSI